MLAAFPKKENRVKPVNQIGRNWIRLCSYISIFKLYSHLVRRFGHFAANGFAAQPPNPPPFRALAGHMPLSIKLSDHQQRQRQHLTTTTVAAAAATAAAAALAQTKISSASDL